MSSIANSKVLVFYLLFLVIFSFFVSSFKIEEDSNKSLSDFAVVTKTISKMNESQSALLNILKYVLIPLVSIDIILVILSMLVITFTSLPIIINTLIFTPIGVIITIDYVLPMIRGN